MLDGAVPRRRRTGFVAPAAAMLQESAGGGSSSGSVGQRETVAPRPRLSEEEERRRKGKMPAVDQSLPPPAEKKLMGDAIRAHAHASTSPPFAAWKDVPFDYGAVSQRLRDVLVGLGVVAGAGPVCVYEKEMTISDRGKEQNRLLISCKDNGSNNGGGTSKGGSKKRNNKGSGDEHRAAATFAKIFSHEELLKVQEGQAKKRQEAEGMKKEKEKPGLGVQAYDRDGEMYELKCRYLLCNSAYRIIDSDYGRFLGNNGLLVVVDPERKKRKRTPEAQGSDGKGGSPLTMGKKRGKGKRPSPEAQGSEGQSSSPSPEPDVGEEARPARIELWAFRSPKLTQGCTDHADGKLFRCTVSCLPV